MLYGYEEEPFVRWYVSCAWHFVVQMKFHYLKSMYWLMHYNLIGYLIHACVIVLVYLFLIGVPNIALESTWYTIKIYSFPLLDLYGKCPVRSMSAYLITVVDDRLDQVMWFRWFSWCEILLVLLWYVLILYEY